ncbi:MAG: C2 domain-containing protein [Cellvibrionaceae bacterium]
MNNQAIPYQQCTQPSALPVPSISIPEYDLGNIVVSFSDIYGRDVINPAISVIKNFHPQSIYNSFISAESFEFFQPLIWIATYLAILIALITFLIYISRKSVFRLTLVMLFSSLFLGFSCYLGLKKITPFYVAFKITENQYSEIIIKTNQFLEIVARLKKVDHLPEVIKKDLIGLELNFKKAQVHAFSAGIKHFLSVAQANDANIDHALSLLSLKFSGFNLQEENKLRSAVYWEASRLSLVNGEVERSLSFAKLALSFNHSEPTLELVQKATAAFVVSSTSAGQFSNALERIDDLNLDWNYSIQQKIIEYLARTQFLQELAETNEIKGEGLEQLTEIYEKLNVRLSRLLFHNAPSTVLSCDMAGMYNLAAAKLLDSGDAEQAIVNFLRAESLLLDGPYTKRMLPLAYNVDGQLKLSKDNNQAALSSFENAYERNPTKEYACNAATALNALAETEGNQRNFYEAFSLLKKADSFCADLDQTRFTKAALTLSRGELAMASGNFYQAKKDFKTAGKRSELAEISRQYLSSITFSKSMLKKTNAIRGMEILPTFDGIICEFDAARICKNMILFKKGKEIGRVTRDFKKLIVKLEKSPGSHLLIRDNNSDGYFEEYAYVSRYSEYVYYDLDKDHRPDWLRRFNEGSLTEDRPLSGVVAIQFSGAINDASDPFSEPDSYLILRKNGYIIGRSETRNNNTYPTWRNEFVIDYKWRDKLNIAVFDKDVFYDDFIDSLEIEELPTTGYKATNYKRVALALKVSPSDKPEGKYKNITSQDDINPFLAPSWESESTDLAKIIQHSRKEQSQAQFRALVASFVAPEIMLATVSPPLSFYRYFVIGVGGHIGTNKILTYKN